MNMKSIFTRLGIGTLGLWVLAVVLIPFVGDIRPAGAQSIETLRVSTLAEATDRTQFFGLYEYYQEYAQSFCTGYTAVTLTKVRLPTSQYSSAPAPSVTIRTDSSNAPGRTIHTLTTPSSDNDISTHEDFTSTGIELAARTNYWLVFHKPPRTGNMSFEFTRSKDESSAEAGWFIGDNGFYRFLRSASSTSDLWRADTYSMRMAIYASGNAPSVAPPVFADMDCNGVVDHLTLRVNENAATSTVVGTVAAADPDNDTLTYSVSGREAAEFNQVFAMSTSTGETSVKSGASLNYEEKRSYSITVNVTDGKDSDGNAESTAATDDSVPVTIRVNNIDEPGTISLSPSTPRVDSPLEALVIDPDGLRGIREAQWFRGDTANGPFTGAGLAHPCSESGRSCYTPSAADQGKFLKVTISYHDLHGTPSHVRFNRARLIQALRTEEATYTNAVAAQEDNQRRQVTNSEATGTPGIDGSPKVGETLTANTAGIDDEDGIVDAVFAYQWIRHDMESRTGEDIRGATGSTYTVASTDEERLSR